MTNSSVKKQGPIRTGFVGPAVIVGVVVWLYFLLLFDWQLRIAMQFVGTYLNGAEVNVTSVRTSFIGATFRAE